MKLHYITLQGNNKPQAQYNYTNIKAVFRVF